MVLALCRLTTISNITFDSSFAYSVFQGLTLQHFLDCPLKSLEHGYHSLS